MVCLVLEATFNSFNHIVAASYPITLLLGISVSIYLCKRVIIGPPSKRHSQWRFGGGPIVALDYILT